MWMFNLILIITRKAYITFFICDFSLPLSLLHMEMEMSYFLLALVLQKVELPLTEVEICMDMGLQWETKAS